MEATTDDTGMSPTGQLTPEHARMEDIGHQLVNMEYIQQAIKQQIHSLEDNKDGTMAVELRSILPNLDDLQRSLRKTFDAHARPHIRKLHIFHLPDELLMKIFKEVKESFSISTSAWGESFNTDTTDTEPIRDLRLTCRRFCNASSHLLLESLSVSLTDSSLEHLDEVSRHPAISKGIRSLRINAALYSPAPASSLQDFIDQVFGILQEDNTADFNQMGWRLSELGQANRSRDPTPRSLDLHGRLCGSLDSLRTRNEVLLSCMNHLRNGAVDQDQDQHMATLCQVFRQYCQLCVEQNALLQHDTFARRVAEAAARFPKSTKLLITDFEGHDSLCWSTEFLVPVYNSVRRKLLRPVYWAPAMVSMLPQKPYKLLYQLPNAFFQAGVPLTKLNICLDLSTEHDLGLSEVQAGDLVSATGNLEVLKIFCHFAMQDFRPSAPSIAQVRFSKFASLLWSSTKLKSVTLHLIGSWAIPHSSRGSSAEPLLALLPWASLNKIDLDGVSIHNEELSKYLEKLSPGTCIRLARVHLLDGLWVDLLDVIRAKADCNSRVVNLTGSQGEDLDGPFDVGWNSTLNPATAYIIGQVSQNPLRSSPEEDDTGHDDTNQDTLLGWGWS